MTEQEERLQRKEIAEQEARLQRAIVKVLKSNITLYSVRGGQGVWNITGFDTIADQILTLVDEYYKNLYNK